MSDLSSKVCRQLRIDAADVGQRLDRVLCRHLTLSRQQARNLLESGLVCVNGCPIDLRGKGRLLNKTDRIDVGAFNRPAEQRPISEPNLKIEPLARTADWLMVNKPAGMAVHPLRADERGTVLNSVIAHHGEIFGIGEGGLRSGIVHRLDVGTSGALLLALNQRRWRILRHAFSHHQVVKVYLAIVCGRLTAAGSVTLPLVVARHVPAHVRVSNQESARQCTLGYQVIEFLEGATLLEIQLATGFLHQIRATMSHLGHPILGDAVYGQADPMIGRPLLHAARLQCGDAQGSCPPPEDFQQVLDQRQL